MNQLAQIIYTIEGIPYDIKILFNDFVNNFKKKEFWIKGTKCQIMDIGPKEDLSTTFQLFPSGGGLKMKISFKENPSNIDVLFDKSFEIIVPKGLAGKMMRKMMDSQKEFLEKSIDLQMIPLIRNTIQELIKHIEEDTDSQVKETEAGSPQDPLQILKIQFAKGEISEEVYMRKKKILEE